MTGKKKREVRICEACKKPIKRGQSWSAVVVGKDKEGFCVIEDYHLNCRSK